MIYRGKVLQILLYDQKKNEIDIHGSPSQATKTSVNPHVNPHVRAQSKVGRTEPSTFRTCYSSLWVKSPLFAGLALLVQVLQALVFEGFDSLVGSQSPGTAVSAESFPALKWDTADSKGCFQAVLEALDITQYITGKTTVLIPIHSYLAL